MSDRLSKNVIYNEDCLGKSGLCVLPDASVDMVLCDLPYGVTANKWDKQLDLGSLFAEYRRLLKTPGTIVLTGQQPFTTDLINAGREIFKYELIWSKSMATGFLDAKRKPLRSHENVLIFAAGKYNPQKTKGKPYSQTRGRASTNYGKHHKTKTVCLDGRRYPKSVFSIKHDKSKHPTQKPVALFEYLINTYSDEGDTILDNCMGSGTTAVACIKTGREYIGFETEPQYYKICQERVSEELSARSFFTEPEKPDWSQREIFSTGGLAQ